MLPVRTAAQLLERQRSLNSTTRNLVYRQDNARVRTLPSARYAQLYLQSHLLGDQLYVTACLQRFHVSPRSVVPKHLNIYEPDKYFFQQLLIQLGVLETRLQHVNFSSNDDILFCF